MPLDKDDEFFNSRFDYLPDFRLYKPAQVADVRSGNDYVSDTKRQRLSGQNHVCIDGIIARGWLTVLPSQCPKLGGLSHGGRRKRVVFKQSGQRIQFCDSGDLLGPKQFTPHLVVGNLGNDYTATGVHQRL